MSLPEKGVIYDMKLPRGEVLRVQLAEIVRNTYVPTHDYLFRCYTPCELVNLGNHEGGFPLPEGLLGQCEFTTVTGPEADALLAEPCEVPFKNTAMYTLFAGMPENKGKSMEEIKELVDGLMAEIAADKA
jgi:hypothetical protein